MPPMTSKPSDSNNDGKESSDPEHQPQAASSEEQTCTATEQQDCPQAASDSTTPARDENEAKVQEPAENVGSVESSVEIASPRAAVESSDSEPCCGGAAAMSADDKRETADIIGAAAQLLSVGVHLLKAVARDQPAAEETSELQAPPGEGTRLIHAVREFLINPELLQPELAAAEIMREVNRPRRRHHHRRLPLQRPGETLREYATSLACFVLIFIAAVALFIYLAYTTYFIFVERPSKP